MGSVGVVIGTKESLYTAGASLPGEAMLDKLTKESFEPITSSVFAVALDDGRTLPLELIAVRGNGLQGLAKREQFSLQFRGPSEPALVQRIYRLAHAELGAMEIFIVPIGHDAAGMTYEAVFT
jgi:hypothetical protein